MDKKAQVLIIGLWILVILTILSVSIGHRVSFGLRLSRYQRDRVKAYCLAKAGVNRAILELENDKNGYDSLGEIWSTGLDSNDKHIFENIEIKEGSGEKFTVKYLYDKDKNIYRCMADEERRININMADKDLLATLFLEKGGMQSTEDAEEAARLVCTWRGDAGLTDIPGFKKAAFVVPEELLVVLEYFYQNKHIEDYKKLSETVYAAIKNFITVYPINIGANLKINLNTVSQDVLTMLLEMKVVDPTYKQFIAPLVDKIINFQEADDGPFKDDSKVDDFKKSLTKEEASVFKNIETSFTLTSDNFRIESTGSINNVSKKITVVYNRKDKKLVYWHEN